MKKFFPVFGRVPLFEGIPESDYDTMFSCIGTKVTAFPKNDFIFAAGDTLGSVCIVLSGTVQVIDEDFWGNRNLLAEFVAGDLFAESFAFAKTKKAPVTAVAVEESEILFLEHGKIMSPCCNGCRFHLKMIENMLSVLAGKNILLNEKSKILSKRTTRDKLLTYLAGQAKRLGNNSFSIPFDRQELADFLCVDRSALSGELGKLRDEGILQFHKNEFEIHKTFPT